MTKTEVMKELRANGSAQTRKIYRRHGGKGDMFGVSYAFLGKMKRKIKTDQKLAEQLWVTGNYDARILATMVADAPSMTAATLDSWARDLEDRHLDAALSNVAAEAPSARKRMEKWTSTTARPGARPRKPSRTSRRPWPTTRRRQRRNAARPAEESVP